MRKNEKNGSTGRTICTRSLASASAEQETPALRRSNRGTPSTSTFTSTKLITPTSSTRKSERLAPSPSSLSNRSSRMQKKNTASPLPRSVKGKIVSSDNSKGSSDKSGRNAATSSDIEECKDKTIINIEEPTDKIKKQEPKMTGRSYRALYRAHLKKEVQPSSNDEELETTTVHHVLGCSRRIPAGNDDAREDNSSPRAHSESKGMPVGETSSKKGSGFPLKLIRDTEKTVLDASPIVETGDDSVIGSPPENSETQKVLVSKASLETDIDVPLKRKRDTAGIERDACAIDDIVADAEDRVMISDELIPSPSGCKNKNQHVRCSTCEKRQKVNGDFENLSVCSCIVQPIQESDHVAQDMKESGPATSRDYAENMQNMQQDKSCDPKLSSMYPEYWVPVQLSDVQLEQYCQTLYSKSLSLSSLSKSDLVGALEETLTSVRKTCDHPYVMDASWKRLLTKNLELHEFLDVEVKASGKLHLLDAMLTQIKTNGLKAVVFYQATKSPEGLLLANILEDFVSQRFGQNSYEHGVCLSKKNAINNFNKESQCFVLLLETRACSQSIKLLRADAFILFGSSLNPSHDIKLLEKIKIESYSERTKIFRLYSTCTVEEKSLILARQNKRQNKALENLNRPLTHALLMWGASYLFDKLDHFHGSETPDSGVSFEQSIKNDVIHEFSSILSSKVREENEGKLCLLLEAKLVQGTYSTDSTLFGEEHVKLSDEDSPNIFWTKLLGGKNPMWKYCSDTPQRSRKRVQYLQGSEETAKVGNGGNIKKRKKASDDVTVDNDERKACGKDHMGVLESPIVIALESSRNSASGTNGTLNGNDTCGLYSVGGHISGIPDDMLAGIDWRQIPHESQKNLHALIKLEMAKLCQVLHLSEDSRSMAENFLEYVIENHRVCKEPATTLQAFQIALSWIAALLVEEKLNREESMVCAKSELAFNCCREEVDYIYSMLYCMKSLFLERTQGLWLNCFVTNSKQSTVSTKQVNESLSGASVRQEKNNTKLMRSSEGEECMTEKRCGHYSSATKDLEKALSYIKKKCKKRLQNLKEKYEEKKLERVNMHAEKMQKLENNKELESALIRLLNRYASLQTLEDALKRLDLDHERKIDKITSERDEGLQSLEQMHEAEKKKLAEGEAYWTSRVEKWAQAELKHRAPIKSGSNKHFSGISSLNTSKNAPDVQTCNDGNGDATYTDKNCMVSKGNEVPEAENTLGTMSGGSSQQIHGIVASRNDKTMDVSTLSGEQPTDNAATKSQSNEHHNEEACSLDKETSDELALPVPHPASVVETSGFAESDQDDQATCPMPSSPAGQQPDPAANIQGRDIESVIEPQSAGSAMPSSSAVQQPDPAAKIRCQNIEAATQPQSAGSETVETGGSTALEQDHQVACPLPSLPTGNQPDSRADIAEGQNINTPAEPHVAGPGAVEIGDSAVSDQEIMGAQDACSLPSSLVGTHADLVANTEGQNITTETQLHTAGSDAGDAGGTTVSDQGAQDASPLPFSLPGNHLDTAVNVEGRNNTTVAVTCDMEIAEPGPQVERSTSANNVGQLVHEGGVEPSAGVTAHLPSRLNNGTGQSAIQPVPQIPFPLFTDPFQHELEKLRRESENSKKTYEEKISILKAELERKMAEVQAEYQRKFHEVEAERNARTTKIETNKKLVIMNKLLANAFLSKCTNRNASHPSAAPRGRIQQLAQRAAQVSALRNYTAPAPGLVQPHASSFPSSVSRTSGLPLNSAQCPIPQPRQPLISSTAPSLSASPATNPAVNARLRSPAPYLHPYMSSSQILVPTTTPTSLPIPQPLTYSTLLIQRQQQEQQHQQQNLGSGLQRSNDVVCLSDDE